MNGYNTNKALFRIMFALKKFLDINSGFIKKTVTTNEWLTKPNITSRKNITNPQNFILYKPNIIKLIIIREPNCKINLIGPVTTLANTYGGLKILNIKSNI